MISHPRPSLHHHPFSSKHTAHTPTRNSPSEFHITGTLRDFSLLSSLHLIKTPTLLINGKYDEATEVMDQYFKAIEKVKWVRFGDSSHTPQLEETGKFLKVVGGFLKS
jgi:pimeloyl-ACP methyl ester carboxylesterase